jgi:hypothetical protein
VTSDWTIVITPVDYLAGGFKREFADRVMAEYGWTADQITEIRGREGLMEVDQLVVVDGPFAANWKHEIITCTITSEDVQDDSRWILRTTLSIRGDSTWSPIVGPPRVF